MPTSASWHGINESVIYPSPNNEDYHVEIYGECKSLPLTTSAPSPFPQSTKNRNLNPWIRRIRSLDYLQQQCSFYSTGNKKALYDHWADNHVPLNTHAIQLIGVNAQNIYHRFAYNISHHIRALQASLHSGYVYHCSMITNAGHTLLLTFYCIGTIPFYSIVCCL